jgi:hypothetical protein
VNTTTSSATCFILPCHPTPQLPRHPYTQSYTSYATSPVYLIIHVICHAIFSPTSSCHVSLRATSATSLKIIVLPLNFHYFQIYPHTFNISILTSNLSKIAN